MFWHMKRTLLLLFIFNFQFSIFNLFAQRPNQAYWDYIERYHKMAQEQMARYGIPASITLAQAVLAEANWPRKPTTTLASRSAWAGTGRI